MDSGRRLVQANNQRPQGREEGNNPRYAAREPWAAHCHDALVIRTLWDFHHPHALASAEHGNPPTSLDSEKV